MNAFYVIAAALSWGVIAAVLVIDVVFGMRGYFHVKRERVTSLPEGFSPLDYQRVVKGKTRPDKLTRALLVWWAQRGYIIIKGLSYNTVRVWKLKNMPPHHKAKFFDRGTYVREREIFNHVFSDVATETGYKDIKLNAPLISRKSAESINKSYSIGENEGVFGTKHFVLKIVTQILCFVPYFLAVAWGSYNTGDAGIYVGLSIFSVIGVLALKYLIVLPTAIRIPFFSIWGGAPFAALVSYYVQNVYDPWYFGVAALAFYVLGTFFFILFADYRENENLQDFSDVYNFRKYVFFVRKYEVDVDYCEVLPFLYTMHCAPLLKHKFRTEAPPAWYSGVKGALL